MPASRAGGKGPRRASQGGNRQRRPPFRCGREAGCCRCLMVRSLAVKMERGSPCVRRGAEEPTGAEPRWGWPRPPFWNFGRSYPPSTAGDLRFTWIRACRAPAWARVCQGLAGLARGVEMPPPGRPPLWAASVGPSLCFTDLRDECFLAGGQRLVRALGKPGDVLDPC